MFLLQTDKKSYEFWSTQPVLKLDEDITTNEAIERDLKELSACLDNVLPMK